MKLVWMMLIALPMVAFTACGDEDDTITDDAGNAVKVDLKKYSDLLDKTRDDVMKRVGLAVSEETLEGIFYHDLNDDYIDELDIFYTFDERNENGALVTYEKSVAVALELYGFSYTDMFNHLQDLYGKGNFDEEGTYVMEKSGMYIWFDYYDDGETDITYIQKKEWDKINISTRSEAKNAFRAAIRARRGK